MGYIVLLKTVLENNLVENIIQKIPHIGDIELETLYKHCECRCIDIKDIDTSWLETENVVAVYDDEFLLKGGELYANQLASVLYGYLEHGECLCGNVLLCKTTEDGDCIPFDEAEADNIVNLLGKLDGYIKDVEFKVQEPRMYFRAWN